MTAASGEPAARSRMLATGFTHPAVARVAELAHLVAGLVFPPNRQPSAEAGMRRAMSVLHIAHPPALLRAFETPGDARDAVLAELTVGESYFFRDAAQLDLLTTEILPSRLATHGPSRPLRVWSAGCASGEEPHTASRSSIPIRPGRPSSRISTAAGRRTSTTRSACRRRCATLRPRWSRTTRMQCLPTPRTCRTSPRPSAVSGWARC